METLDFSNKELCREYADAIARAVDKTFEDEDTEGYRTHLGASVIGHECHRYLFYHFRWMHKESYQGRMLRLFNNGHGFEVRVRHALSKIGFQFIDGLEESGRQLRFSAIGGHFGGSVDGVFIAPDWGIPDPTLLECKTSGTGAGFNNLQVKGVDITKPQHFAQNSTYGRAFGIRNCLYVAENKNDSDWSFNLLSLDWKLAEECYNKAQFVILDCKEPPKRISQKRNFFVCNMCKMQPICHDNVPTDVNCRSCRYAQPVVSRSVNYDKGNAEWYCDKWQSTIPKDAILNACPEHDPIQRVF